MQTVLCQELTPGAALTVPNARRLPTLTNGSACAINPIQCNQSRRQAELAAACARLAQHPFVTVDTEFLRETTYYPKLCVARWPAPTRPSSSTRWRPRSISPRSSTLMANERVVKVFHAARQDIEIVWHVAGTIPHPLFDTQVAAMVLGYGDSISYDQLVQRITGDTLDKSPRFTDWSRRPLTRRRSSPMRSPT